MFMNFGKHWVQLWARRCGLERKEQQTVDTGQALKWRHCAWNEERTMEHVQGHSQGAIQGRNANNSLINSSINYVIQCIYWQGNAAAAVPLSVSLAVSLQCRVTQCVTGQWQWLQLWQKFVKCSGRNRNMNVPKLQYLKWLVNPGLCIVVTGGNRPGVFNCVWHRATPLLWAGPRAARGRLAISGKLNCPHYWVIS
jgi:hypothetical protein